MLIVTREAISQECTKGIKRIRPLDLLPLCLRTSRVGNRNFMDSMPSPEHLHGDFGAEIKPSGMERHQL